MRCATIIEALRAALEGNGWPRSHSYGRAQAFHEHSRGKPFELLTDQPVSGILTADSSGVIDVAPHYRFTCDSPDNVDELVNRHHFLRTDVNGLRQL
jgi:hypothetical protein